MSLKSVIRTRLSAALLTPVLLAGVAACTTNEPEVPAGDFYVFNANPTVPTVQMNIDEQGPTFTSGVVFGRFCCSPPVRVRESDIPRQVRLTSGTGTTVIAGADIQVYRDSIYFLTLARHETNPALSELLIFKNNIAGPADDKAKLRFVHTAPAIVVGATTTVSAIDVYVTAKDADLATATPMFANLQYGDVVDHVVFTPPTDTLLVRVTKVGDKVSAPLFTRKYSTRSDAQTEYLGVGSFNTIFLINSSNTPFLLPIGVFQVGGL